MANYFKVIKHRSDGCLYLELRGDLDGTSALELINVLKETCPVDKIFIDTHYLRTIHPFGSHVFEKHIYELNGLSEKIYVTGGDGYHIVPIGRQKNCYYSKNNQAHS